MVNKDVKYKLCMRFNISVGWVFVGDICAGVGRGIVDEVDIGVGYEIY